MSWTINTTMFMPIAVNPGLGSGGERSLDGYAAPSNQLTPKGPCNQTVYSGRKVVPFLGTLGPEHLLFGYMDP